jgi:hypothetical protein
VKPSKVRKTSTASGFYEIKYLQKREFMCGRYCGRYLELRSILTVLRAVTPDSTDRTKYLQIGTFAALRSMRAVFCGFLYG